MTATRRTPATTSDAMTTPPDPDAQAAPAGAGRLGAAVVGLLVIAGLAVFASQPAPIRPLDPFEALGDHVAIGDLPDGFRFGLARTLPGGRAYVQLVRDDPREGETEADEALARIDAERADEEREGAAPIDAGDAGDGEDPEGDGDADGDEPRLSETAAERERFAVEDGTPPSVVWLMRYPRDRALAVLQREMKRKVEDPRAEPSKKNLELTVDGGRLAWGDYEADYVQEREYEVGDHFTDVVRVNLTLGDECWILVALWPRDYRGSTEPIARLLEALPPR